MTRKHDSALNAPNEDFEETPWSWDEDRDQMIGTSDIDFQGFDSKFHQIMLEAESGTTSWGDVCAFLTYQVNKSCLGTGSTTCTTPQMYMDECLTRTEGTFGQTPLHIAARKAPLFVIDFLLIHAPAAVRISDSKGFLPLHYAARENEHADVALVLFGHYRAAVSMTNNDGHLPLHCAAACNEVLDVVAALLDKYPAAAFVGDNEERKPLHLATQTNGNPSVAALLFDAFPDAALMVDNNGNYPAFMIFFPSYSSPIDKMRSSLRREILQRWASTSTILIQKMWDAFGLIADSPDDILSG
uniref:Uncharacterized protein n=1 Tax=Leptocylindrus danicus TaxID=163516 RepID=A0A7S2NSV9_9STRA|mmetsp:Transcript_12292/g.18494  ORF Transcript_12292/g.18494 Transcript_12292/m.18494 type:complete len:300 (+) Transcript_12292:100-999(+)|eukprot:CAMPEP_0116009510 /NCGR_PEP_ID=MMETSP0321-20121206/3473_1 /TAXON_ID=163516 /ORGANISM="Leptocylindrus danicus var. danicus, Strain B650" /LENGTH=299 /DNA_ID=CAMNT_0003478481 /DNA_START=96 /DNA_END=995 /DNA_ORIENTATION=+